MSTTTDLGTGGAGGTPGSSGSPEGAALAIVPGRARSVRFPRSPKIIIGLVMLGFFLLLAIVGPWLAPYSPGASVSTTNGVPQPPSAAHLLGTTQLQQDVFSQLLVGGRSMLVVALLAGAIATVLSALPLLIVIFGFLPSSGGSNDVLIGLIIAITGWAWGARVLRAQTLSLRNRDYVDSARLAGERNWRIIGYEILPNLLPIVASSFLFTVLYAVGTYTAMAFLGLVNPEHWSWGTMLFWAQQANAQVSGYWWWYIPPGLAVAFLGTSLALLNFGIDEFINPRLRAAGLTRKRVKRYATGAVPRRFPLGYTPVVRLREEGDS